MSDDFPDPLQVAQRAPNGARGSGPLAGSFTRRELGDRFDDLDKVESVVLREGPRSKKLARLITIKNRHTQAIHHHTLTIESGQKRQGSWELDEKRSVTLSSDEGDEIGRLVDFVQGFRKALAPSAQREAGGVEQAGQALHAEQVGLPGQADLPPEQLAESLARLASDREGLRVLARHAKARPEAFEQVAASLSWGRDSGVLQSLKRLVESDAEPAFFQLLVHEHPWLVGLEHGELLEQPRWATPRTHEIELRRDARGKLVLLSVHGVNGSRPLMSYDARQQVHYASAELAVALGQVTQDLGALEAYCEELGMEDATPLTAKLVMGVDGDDAQRAALAAFAGGLARIEVSSYDKLARDGKRRLAALAIAVQGREP